MLPMRLKHHRPFYPHSWIAYAVSRCWCYKLAYVVVEMLATASQRATNTRQVNGYIYYKFANVKTVYVHKQFTSHIDVLGLGFCLWFMLRRKEGAQPKRRKEAWKRVFSLRWRSLNYFILFFLFATHFGCWLLLPLFYRWPTFRSGFDSGFLVVFVSPEMALENDE